MQDEAERTPAIPYPTAEPPDAPAEQTVEPRKELHRAIIEAHDVLVSVTAVFPLSLFPDTVTLDRTKLTITQRRFVGVAEVMSIRPEDLLNATANVGPLFGSVSIMTQVYNNDKPYRIEKLWRDDALKFKRICQGYIIALQKEIDCRSLETKELVTMLEKLGKDDHEP